eukprot:3459419-Alexandrium_andersonii.AAC.1
MGPASMTSCSVVDVHVRQHELRRRLGVAVWSSVAVQFHPSVGLEGSRISGVPWALAGRRSVTSAA